MKIVFVLLIFILSLPLQGRGADYTGRWLDNYGDYTRTSAGKNDFRVKRAFRVFEKVNTAADKGTSALPRLAVIAYGKRAYFEALADGGIIINPVTLDICYEDTSLGEGDCRLAFILGHELAHLANKDSMYEEALDKKELKIPVARFRELFADPQGAIFAAMAGYEIGELFNEDNNFLSHLAQKTGIIYTEAGTKHPTFLRRFEFTRSQLRAIIKRLELFKTGVLLLQMGKYTDGAAAFRAFSNSYPAREVFNNLGVCYLNLALSHLRLKFRDDYSRFRLSTVIDYHTSAEKLYFRGEEDYLKDKDISFLIEKAVFYFREAAYRDRHDRTCRLNLSAAFILKKNYTAALAQCDLLLEKNPKDIETLNNKAIALYYYGKEICQTVSLKTVAVLENARELVPNNYEVVYNLASLARETKQPDKAKHLWEAYLNLANIPRDNFYMHTCKELARKEQEVVVKTALPLVPGGISLGKEIVPLLKKWKGEKVYKYNLTSEEDEPDKWSVSLRVIVKQDLRVLVWEGFIVLVEKTLARAKSASQQLKRFGPPQKITRHTGGAFYVYEDRGFSFKEIDGKIRSYTWFKIK